MTKIDYYAYARKRENIQPSLSCIPISTNPEVIPSENRFHTHSVHSLFGIINEVKSVHVLCTDR